MGVNEHYVPTDREREFYKHLARIKRENPDETFIVPNYGAQSRFILCEAQIVFYGGAAGGGKTFGGLLSFTPHVNKPYFKGVMFRRETTDITKLGGLADESRDLYTNLKGDFNQANFRWTWRKGEQDESVIQLSHMQHEKNKYDHKGGQYCMVMFDEITTFSETMVWYIWGRCRIPQFPDKTYKCPMSFPLMRATTNPDADSWVRDFIDWWIDDKGFAIPARSGVIRWFVKDPHKGGWHWEDSKIALDVWISNAYRDLKPKERPLSTSFTFIPSDLSDNPYLNDDGVYRTTLTNQDPVESARLLGGNWNIKASAGSMFQPDWVEFIDHEDLPDELEMVRGWDIAATEPTPQNQSPDSTSGVLMGKCKEGFYYIIDCVNEQFEPNEVWDLMVETAERDGKFVQIDVPQDPAAAGKGVLLSIIKPKLADYDVVSSLEIGKKTTRFRPFSAMCYRDFDDKMAERRVKIVKGKWNRNYIDQLLAYPTKGAHDDDVDATSRAFNNLHAEDDGFDPRDMLD